MRRRCAAVIDANGGCSKYWWALFYLSYPFFLINFFPMVSLFLAYFTVVCIYCRKTLLLKNRPCRVYYVPFPSFCYFLKPNFYFQNWIKILISITNVSKWYQNVTKTLNFMKIQTVFRWVQWCLNIINSKSCSVSFAPYCIHLMMSVRNRLK